MNGTEKATLASWSLDELLARGRYHEICDLPAGPARGASPGARLQFVNELMRTGIFGSIVLEPASPRAPNGGAFSIREGTDRIDAVLSVLNGRDLSGCAFHALFDLGSSSFVESPSSPALPYSIDPWSWMRRDLNEAMDELTNSLVATGAAPEVKKRACKSLGTFYRLLDTTIPVYLVPPEKGAVRYDPSDGAVAIRPSPDPCPFGNSRCTKRYINPTRLAGDAFTGESTDTKKSVILETTFKPLLGHDDLLCRVSEVPEALVASLALPYCELEVYLQAVRQRAGMILMAGIAGSHETTIASSMASLATLQASALGQDDLYDIEVLRRIQNLLSELVHTLNGISATLPSPPGDLLLLSLIHSGVFLPSPMGLGGKFYKPGVYVAEGLQGREAETVIRHELAHAYLRFHKKKILDCRWIEEGLAEWLSRGHPDYSEATLATAKGSNLAFYDYFKTLAAMPKQGVLDLAGHWLQGDVQLRYWCDLVEEFLLAKSSRGSSHGKKAVAGKGI